MSTNINDITLQSTDGVLRARNNEGNLIYPMLFVEDESELNNPNIAQGFDSVLVVVDGDGSMDIDPTVIHLTEENNYFQSLYMRGEGAWTIRGADASSNIAYAHLDSSSGQMMGVGDVRIDVTSLVTTPGEYTSSFVVVLSNGTEITIPVTITVSQQLTVNGRTDSVTINLNAGNNYTETLSVVRDREWTVENVDTNKIIVTPTSGNGAATLTVTKSPNLSSSTATTTFQVVSFYQRVDVTVNITITATGRWLDPLPNEPGVIGTDSIYLYD